MTSTGVLYDPCVKLTNGRYRCSIVTAAHILGGVFFENISIERYENGISMGNAPASVIARDYDNDLALLHFETDKPLSAPVIAPNNTLRAGMRGLSQVGCPQGDSSLSFLNGFGGCTIIKCATNADSILTCSPAGQKGRSGGPLFTPDGRLAGITLAVNTATKETFFTSGEIVAEFVKKNTPPTQTLNQQKPIAPQKIDTQEPDLTPEEIKRLSGHIDTLEKQIQDLNQLIKLLKEKK